MLTSVDHVMVVGDVDRAVETYRRLGFTVTGNEDARSAEGRVGFMPLGNFHLEFRSESNHPTQARAQRQVMLRSDGLDGDVERLRSSGFSVSEPFEATIATDVGVVSRRGAVVEAGIPVGLVEYESDGGRTETLRAATVHPNTATVAERVYLAVESIEAALGIFERMLGMSAPEPEMGTVIMSLMSVFYLGDIGIAVAEPRGRGPTSSALAANGPGLFQVLLRAEHLDVAAAEMVARGASVPTRGTRLSGESALLVDPADACGLYVAFAGPP